VRAFHLAGATIIPSGVRVGWARPAIYIIRAEGKVTHFEIRKIECFQKSWVYIGGHHVPE
jgi:hypothetical protein